MEKMEFHFSRGNNFLALALYASFTIEMSQTKHFKEKCKERVYKKWHMYLYESNTAFVVYEWNMNLVCTIVWWVFDFVGNHHVWFFVKNQKQSMGGGSDFRILKRTGGFLNRTGGCHYTCGYLALLKLLITTVIYM
jgi:hypothetical protein